jgi:glutaredoxin
MQVTLFAGWACNTNPKATACILGLGLSFCQIAAALTVRDCIDPAGHHTFEDHCPPASREVARKELADTPVAAAKPAVTLYVTQDCEACESINELLQKRGVTFVRKDVSNDIAAQTELQNRTGALLVPTLAAGDKTVTGYNKKQIDEALTAIGYSEPALVSPTAAP